MVSLRFAAIWLETFSSSEASRSSWEVMVSSAEVERGRRAGRLAPLPVADFLTLFLEHELDNGLQVVLTEEGELEAPQAPFLAAHTAHGRGQARGYWFRTMTSSRAWSSARGSEQEKRTPAPEISWMSRSRG